MKEPADHVAVERGTRWLTTHNQLPTAERRANRATRPRLNQADKIAVLAATNGTVPNWVATDALGINGQTANRYLAASGRTSDPSPAGKVNP